MQHIIYHQINHVRTAGCKKKHSFPEDKSETVIRYFLFSRSFASCEMTAPGPSQSLYTGLSSRSHSLASRSRSVHSLLNMEIPPPPKALRSNTNTKDTKHKRTDPPALEISHRDSGQSLHRSQSQDRLEDWAPVLGDSASLRARPLRPPYSDMRSVSVEHQPPEERSGLYRTISRATLVDQDTGNVYQVIRHSYSCEQSEI